MATFTVNNDFWHPSLILCLARRPAGPAGLPGRRGLGVQATPATAAPRGEAPVPRDRPLAPATPRVAMAVELSQARRASHSSPWCSHSLGLCDGGRSLVSIQILPLEPVFMLMCGAGGMKAPAAICSVVVIQTECGCH